MKAISLHLLLFVWHLIFVDANVEKIIFMSPEEDSSSSHVLTGSQLAHLEALSPSKPSIRRKLHAKFDHSPSLQEPSEAWILLSDLTVSQRHEVRVCWPATVRTLHTGYLMDPRS